MKLKRLIYRKEKKEFQMDAIEIDGKLFKIKFTDGESSHLKKSELNIHQELEGYEFKGEIRFK